MERLVSHRFYYSKFTVQMQAPLFSCHPCANAHGTASETAFAATPSQICAEAPAAKRLGVPSLPSRELRAKHAPARPQRGNPKGGAALFGQSLPTFCWPESRGPRAACEVPRRGKRVEGKSEIFKKHKRDQKRKPRPASKGKIENLKKGKGITKVLGKIKKPTLRLRQGRQGRKANV